MGGVKWYLAGLALIVVASAASAKPKEQTGNMTMVGSNISASAALAETKEQVDSVSITGAKARSKMTANGATTTIENGEMTIGEGVAKIKADSIVANFAKTSPEGLLKSVDFSGNVSLAAENKEGLSLTATAKKGSMDWGKKTITLYDAAITLTQIVTRPDGSSEPVSTLIENSVMTIQLTDKAVVCCGPEAPAKAETREPHPSRDK